MVTIRSKICLTTAEAEDVLSDERCELVTVGPKPYRATLTEVRFGSISMCALSESAARLKFKRLAPDATILEFPTREGVVLAIDGLMVPFGTMLSHPPGHHCYERISGSADIGIIALPNEHVALNGGASGRSCLAPSAVPLLLTPAPQDFLELLELHEAVAALTSTDMDRAAGDAFSRLLETLLQAALLECAAGSIVKTQTAGQAARSRVVRRFRSALVEARGEPVDVSHLCAAIGVAERTLRVCCQEHLGMGPKRYVMLRNLQLARRALLTSGPSRPTVTEVAMQFGFWHLGRFSSHYRALFDELPSATLAAVGAPGGCSGASSSSAACIQ